MQRTDRRSYIVTFWAYIAVVAILWPFCEVNYLYFHYFVFHNVEYIPRDLNVWIYFIIIAYWINHRISYNIIAKKLIQIVFSQGYLPKINVVCIRIHWQEECKSKLFENQLAYEITSRGLLKCWLIFFKKMPKFYCILLILPCFP